MKDRVKAPKYKQMQQPNPYVSLGFAHTKPASSAPTKLQDEKEWRRQIKRIDFRVQTGTDRRAK